jgi:hypothetical protein
MQNVLGSYDAALGINDNQLSGVAIIEGATQSNCAAMPYVIGFLQGLQRIAEVYVDLIPKYYVTPRTVPILGIDGKRTYRIVNAQNTPSMNYDPYVLNVKVEAGVSFHIQKSRALQQIIGLMQASQQFAQFMNEQGLPVLLDNIEIRGIDQLKIMAEQWMQQQAQMKQQAMQMQQQAMQQNPQMIKAQNEKQKLQLDGMKAQTQFQIDMQKLKQAEAKLVSDAMISKSTQETQLVKAETERFSKQIDLELKNKDMQHRHMKEAIETHHKVNSTKGDKSHVAT